MAKAQLNLTLDEIKLLRQMVTSKDILPHNSVIVQKLDKFIEQENLDMLKVELIVLSNN